LIRKPLLWVTLLLLVTVLYGCPRKKPTTTPAAAAAASTAPAPPATEVRQAKAPAAMPPADPLLSSDMAVVNAELLRRGFTPDVYFDFDQSALKEAARDKLARNGTLLRDHAKFDLMIEGHCDERGTAEYNLALGERRANSVKGYLVSLGVAGNRLRTLSYGSEHPVCTEHEESCWGQNRRAHMVVSGRSDSGPLG
jgi:peptidoglycan-associated lipoprotein